MKVALIEDEVPALEHLEALVQRLRPGAHVVARLRTVRQVRVWLAQADLACDLILADIQLGDGRSLDALGEADPGVPIIFTTAHDDFMAEAFERNGIAYLLKPVSVEALGNALDRHARLEQHFMGALRGLLRELESPATPQRLVGRRGSDWVGVELSSVRWVRVRHGITTAVTADGAHIMLEEPLQRLQQMLEPARFFRANRWYMVSLPAVARVRPVGRGRLSLVLDPDPEEAVEVTQQHAAAFRRWYGMP